jgi:hypothetical protein
MSAVRRAELCYDSLTSHLNGASLRESASMEDPITRGLGTRRDEDIALDLMKFIAGSTGYGKTSAPGVGFQGGVSSKAAEEYAQHLLELYGRCLQAVQGKK